MPTPPLPDSAARATIADATDLNLVVEAAAGTGKTTCLVARLLTLLRRGALAGEERLAAVTFTHKAAAELRERLERELAAALADPDALPPDELDNLRAAADALPECHIGTIHSFCARILRERPVEAGISPDFRELDDEQDLALRRRAWKEFSARLARGDHGELYRVFELFGLDLGNLGAGFERYAEFPDVTEWAGADAGLDAIDTDAFIRGADVFCDGLGKYRDLDDADPGRDTLIRAMQIVARRLPRLRRPVDMAEAYELCRQFPEKPTLVQAQWAQLGIEPKAAKEEEKPAYDRFFAETVKPFRDACLAAAYAAALRAFALAGEIYDALRHAGGTLNFQDLLMRSAAMLRTYPAVRDEFAGRYARLLVDEVQDTDPIQAEIMFLLAARPGGGDWRERTLRPGALFMVGDPKQSIYRFRRADILVYQEMKRLVQGQGGLVLGLSTNFRAQPAVIEWINAEFFRETGDTTPEEAAVCGRFGDGDTPYGPAYIPLEPGLPEAPDGCFAGVYSIEAIGVDKKAGVDEAGVFRDEAARIAAFIRHAVDAGLLLPGRDGPRPATPGDFLIVPYDTKTGGYYAEALRRRGLPCQMSCGGALGDSPALRLLLPYLKALAYPDDPVLLVAVLRGGLFGVSDPDLYRWKKAGGGFTLLHPVPSSPGAAASPLPQALGMMERHFRLFRTREPMAALSEVLDDLGIWVVAGTGDDPAVQAGVLAGALEALADGRPATLAELAEDLEWLMEESKLDPEPAVPRTESAVRVMNLHKTKGLEAPVVFLACTRKVRKHPVAFTVRRGQDGVVGAMAIYGGEFGSSLLARPMGWETMADEEALFLAAEKTRLNYVAATRAGAALVVTIHCANKVWKSEFLPECRRGVTIGRVLDEPSLPPPGDAAATIFDPGPELEEAARLRRERRETMLAPTYGAARAKPESGGERSGVWPEAGGENDDALNLGEVLHRLLAVAVPGRDVAAEAAELLREFELPDVSPEEAAAMVAAARNSVLWKRAAAADRVFREAPFAIRLDGAGGPVLQRGVIDLVFREKKGWVVADYKSDRLPRGADPARAAARHAGQLAAYAAAWEAITREPVVEKGIFFLRSGEYAVVGDGDPDATA